MTVELVRQFARELPWAIQFHKRKSNNGQQTECASRLPCCPPSGPTLPARVHVQEFFALGESMRRAEQSEVNGQLACNAERESRSFKSPRGRAFHGRAMAGNRVEVSSLHFRIIFSYFHNSSRFIKHCAHNWQMKSKNPYQQITKSKSHPRPIRSGTLVPSRSVSYLCRPQLSSSRRRSCCGCHQSRPAFPSCTYLEAAAATVELLSSSKEAVEESTTAEEEASSDLGLIDGVDCGKRNNIKHIG